MRIFVKTIPYSQYLSKHVDGGAVFKQLEARVAEGTMSQEERDKYPISEKEWDEVQGTPMIDWLFFTEDEKEHSAGEEGVSDPVRLVESVDDIAKTLSGYTEFSEGQFLAQHAKQEALAESVLATDLTAVVTLTPAESVLVCDNFQDGKSKAPYNLQVRNTTGDTVAWVAVIEDTPYKSIPALVEGNYELDVTESEKGYTYTFSGKLDGYESITVTGGVPSPVGSGKTETSPALFIKE